MLECQPGPFAHIDSSDLCCPLSLDFSLASCLPACLFGNILCILVRKILWMYEPSHVTTLHRTFQWLPFLSAIRPRPK